MWTQTDRQTDRFKELDRATPHPVSHPGETRVAVPRIARQLYRFQKRKIHSQCRRESRQVRVHQIQILSSDKKITK